MVHEKQVVDMVRNGRLPCVSNFREYLLLFEIMRHKNTRRSPTVISTLLPHPLVNLIYLNKFPLTALPFSPAILLLDKPVSFLL
jgi:hypothetical protein